jgi:hypothetical protein
MDYFCGGWKKCEKEAAAKETAAKLDGSSGNITASEEECAVRY